MKLINKHMPEIIKIFNEVFGQDYAHKDNLFRGFSDEQIDSIAYWFDTYAIPFKAYVEIEVVSAKYDTLRRSGLLESKDFTRDLKRLKDKADLIANLQCEKIVIPIPIPLSDIQAILYNRLKSFNINDYELRIVMNIIFNKQGHKGSMKEVSNDNFRIIDSFKQIVEAGFTPHYAMKFRYDKTYIAIPK